MIVIGSELLGRTGLLTNEKRRFITVEKKVVQSEDEHDQIGQKLQLLLRTGQILMENGANTNRIVRTMKRVAAYMYIPEDRLHIHITYTTIMANVSDGNHSITKFQKCFKHGIDMAIISAISKLSIRALEQDYSLEEYNRQLDTFFDRDRFYKSLLVTVGAGFACGGFCKLFGCDWPAFFYTSICAMAGFYIRHQCKRMDINSYVSIFIAAFVSTCLAFLTHLLPGSSTPWHPMLACALFIVPGIPLMNAVDDLLDDYIVSGMTRATNALMMVGSMSFGIAFAIRLCQVEDFTMLSMEPQGSYFVYAVAAAIAAVGFSTLFNVPLRLLWVIAIGGILSVCVRNFVNFELGQGLAIASFIGAMTVSVIGIKAVHWFHTPSHVLTIPSVIPLIPGVLMYRMLFGLININQLDEYALMQAFQSGINALLILLGIALGVAVPDVFARKYLDAAKRAHLRKLLAARNSRKRVSGARGF